MDSNNTKNNELDIRDIASYLLGKLWIIALVVLCFAIIAFLWTQIFVTDVYSSTTKMFIINAAASDKQQTSDWSIGKQLTKTSSELIRGDYCDHIAERLNAHVPGELPTDGSKPIDLSASIGDGIKFTDYYAKITGKSEITGNDIRSYLSVASDDETCIISVTATCVDPKLAAAISQTTLSLFGDYINGFMEVSTIKTTISRSGIVPTAPSNNHTTRNMILASLVGAVVICAILIVVFIFDDKIKTPDDIEKQLKLSVLGTIPEIEEA
ncbi:MAG: hypothetical protein J6B34_06265 [Clostridia bacterium]|nr:hypothetical protein [Clostridia bacterium]